MVERETSQDEQYQAASQEFGEAIGRLVNAYERDPDKRKDLIQDLSLIHISEPTRPY